MAPKQQPINFPPHIDTSGSETDSEDHSTSTDGSDSEPQQLTQTKPQQTHQESQDSSDSDSDSDSDASSDKTQKPFSPEPKKPISEPTQLKANGKRPAEIDQIDKASKTKKSEGVDKVGKGSKSDLISDKSKRAEKVDNEGTSVEKGVSKSDGGDIGDKKFARLFTENDEIVLLEGMIEFREKKGTDPSLNIVAFHEFVEDLLSCSVTKSQIADKIRRLKKKFVNNLKKGQDGKDPVISRPHEYKSFELSKKIWGSEVQGSELNGEGKVKSSRKKDDNVGSKTRLKSVKESDFEEEVMDKSEIETEDWWSLYPSLCASLESEAIKNFTVPMNPKEYVKKVVSGLRREKARELEQEWEFFSAMEQQVYVKRVEMISKQAEAAMKVIQP